MHKIRFGCSKSELEDYMTTTIFVNGIDLNCIIEEIETEQFVKRGLTLQNGGYEGISFFIAFHNQNHFLCSTLKDYIYQEGRGAIPFTITNIPVFQVTTA